MATIIETPTATIIFANSSDTVIPDAIRGTQTPIEIQTLCYCHPRSPSSLDTSVISLNEMPDTRDARREQNAPRRQPVEALREVGGIVSVANNRIEGVDTLTLPKVQTPLVCNDTQIPYVVMQQQVHGNTGLAVTQDNYQIYRTLLTHDSDYLATNLPGVGLGVLTADCLPIALVDPVQHAIAIIHAGWRGSVGNITGNAINHMHALYGSKPTDIHAWFGPCAHPCCYTVNETFIKQLPDWALPVVTADQQFDLLMCNTIALRACSVLEKNINCDASQCTICNQQFLSYRRNPSLTARQPSIIWLN